MEELKKSMDTLFDILQPGDYVVDTWWRHAGIGIIQKKYKKTIHIKWTYSGRTDRRIYDVSHANLFLEKVK